MASGNPIPTRGLRDRALVEDNSGKSNRKCRVDERRTPPSRLKRAKRLLTTPTSLWTALLLGKLRGPMREMIERGRVRVIEL